MTQITYPDEEIVSYTHDASGRIRAVDFNDRTLVEYDYLGELVIGKTLPNAGLQYATTVDTLGRMTGETYSRPATSQTIWTAAYEHLNHSDRLIERSGIDYGFDTLGRVISEDSTPYLCDNLGNPTDAGEDGLSYLLDSEQQIKQVDNTAGTVAVYGYDRIGRRVQKTIGTSEVRFIYDPAGRMIAEYANGEWIRDYVYGASGEAVYMRFPKTDEVIAAETNFWGFINAWLCSPYCTQDDLAWDTNADSQINFIDWAADSNAFTGAFTINERFLLADSRNSVIGKVNLDSSVDLIAYTAFGAPYYAQGADLEGLAILWNGYYFDYETGNYYLRNRYYSPLERRFLTPDPHGVNPDGNWNNPFGPMRQYSDGFGLQIYAGGDPVNGRDDWGLYDIEDGKHAISGFLNDILQISFYGGKQCYNFVFPSPIAGSQITVRLCGSVVLTGCCQKGVKKNCVVGEVSADGGLYAAGTVRPGWSPPPSNWTNPIRFKDLLSSRPGKGFRVPFVHGLKLGCPNEKLQGQMCLTASVGVWSWAAGVRGCVGTPDGRCRIEAGMGIGEGTGVSVGGGFTFAKCWEAQ